MKIPPTFTLEPCSRRTFKESFLMEMPRKVSEANTFFEIEQAILERKTETVKVVDNLYKIQGEQLVYYWYENNNEIVLCSMMEKKFHGLTISLTGKNPKYQNKPPYSVDLYLDILKTSKENVIVSDNKMTLGGLKIWKKLFELGHHITVYDSSQPGNSFKTIDTLEQLEKYHTTNPIGLTTKYVLSESSKVGDINGWFHIRRYREIIDKDD